VERAGIATTRKVLDVGSGASMFSDDLWVRGFRDLSLLDISEQGLDVAKQRHTRAGIEARYIAADITTWKPTRAYDLWHDRAVFHFLTDAADRSAYRTALHQGLAVGGFAIVGTFAKDGPERCSGLPVARYDERGLVRELGAGFELVATEPIVHVTPSQNEQQFLFVLMRRV